MEEKLEKLASTIWTTYKIRINTAERLKRNDRFLGFMSIYYSAILSAISILNYKNKSEIMDIFTIALSIIVTILVLFFEGKSYKERHQKVKQNYNELYELMYSVEAECEYYKKTKANEQKNEDNKIATNEKCEKELTEIDLKRKFEESYKKYIELMNNVENHEEIDFTRFKIYNSNRKNINIGFHDYVKWYRYNFITKFIYTFIFMIPTVMMLFSGASLFIKK